MTILAAYKYAKLLSEKMVNAVIVIVVLLRSLKRFHTSRNERWNDVAQRYIMTASIDM
jgi:hypothetical protein